VYRNSTALLRFALLEKATRPMKDGSAKEVELEEMQILRFLKMYLQLEILSEQTNLMVG